ncbi:hypothetical protein Pst134EA_005336 [Puccinia striiformis f. sp. tritici]|uniref:hypothetical protein n=1 Tax=Puccinia striiformis f. sp. tritici TaxID=168172 RepID=UPI00200779AB|nr:hypothetical protein Pst134EA_005336 [Puccinia striiformis f. sp. tritici]KAH9471436.1 hypothetical protein Pst134EA_005336 [Puccinia striiformis f. sp. tritici]
MAHPTNSWASLQSNYLPHMDSHPLNDSPGLRNGVLDGDHPNLSDRGLYNTDPNHHTSNGPGNSLPSNYLPHMDSHALSDSSGLRNGVSDGDHPNLSDRGLYNTDPNHLTSGSLPPLSHLNQQDHHHQSTYPPPDRSQHPQHGISRDPSNPTNPGSQALQNNAGGGIGPIRGSPATPVHRALPYSRLEGQRLTQDHVLTPSNRSSLSSVGSSHRRNSIQSSTSSDMLAVTIQTETFNSIRNIVKGLQDHGDNTEELTQIAQPLFQIPKEERWPAAVVLILTSFQELTGASQRSKPSSDVSGSEPPKAFISTTVRQLLLQPNLDQYSRGDSKTKKGPNVKTPYTLVKEALDAKDTLWLTQNLSIQWRDNPDDVKRVDKLISAKLKADKNALAAIIKENLDSPDAVETLDQLVTQVYSQLTSRFKDARGKKIANDQHITKPAKARLAYLRFQIHPNNLLIIKNKGTKITTPGFWNQIDKDLAHRSCGTEAYQFAFSNLVLLKDAKVWDGKKGASDVTAEEAALPTEDEIQAEMQRLNGIQP